MDKSKSAEPVFSVLDPRYQEPVREIFGLNPRLNTLEGKTINVINLHGGNEDAFESIAEGLKETIPSCNVVYFRTDGGFGGGPMTDEDWAKMTNCDAAITGHDF